MTDQDLNSKLDRLLALLEAQLELTRQGQREERLRRAHLSREETIDLSHSDEQAGGGDESMIGDPHTPTPAPRPRRSVSFADMDEQEDVNYEKYASPTGPRYVKSRVDPYNKSRTEHYVLDQEEDSSIMTELNRSKPIATPFPKFNPRDVEIFILEAEAWFKFNQVYEQSRMINHMGAQLEGTAREWWTSKLRIDRAREGRLFNDWHYFTERLTEQFNPRNARMEAYNKLLALRLTSDAPGVATRHVERFRDLEGQVNLDDNELVIDLFRGSLTRSLQEKFERNPPNKRWEWYREVEEIDRQRMLLQQASARHSQANNASSPGTRPIQSSIPIWRSVAQPNSTRSPVLFVPKKDVGLRLCVDYRGLNEITVKNRAPLPLIEEQLFLLRKARIYTKLDLRAAYNLIRIAKGDEWKTAFGTQLGLYEYLVMPFGLANAPAHFQSFINDIFRDIIGVYVVVYLDDFLIFSDTEEAHVKHVTEVLTRLRSNRLFAKLSKCEFHTKIVEFLGYIIKPTGIEMDPEKVRTVKDWPMPESIHDIQRFLGFANFYRRFIAHFARIAKPLTSLVKPTERFKKFELPEEAQQAFHQLIQAFTSAGVLQHFDYHLPTRLETNASDFAIAGVLKQEHEQRWHPVTYYSSKMSSAERNYEIHDKELLAVVACLTQWRHMLAGLPSQLVILTDHEALKYFKSQRRITGRQARWAVLLADFDFILQYRPGDKGGEPDALTRRADMQPAGEEQEHNVRQLLPPRVFKETADHDSTLVAPMLSMESIASKGLKDLVKIFQPLDQELQEIHTKKPFEVKDDLWYSGGRLVIPKVTMPGRTNNRHSRSAKEVDGQSLSVEHLRFMVMTQCHDGITAGHVGRDATTKAAQRHYWWPNMTAWIADYVASCPVCARYKAPRHRPYGLLQPLATPDRPWGSISLDFIEGLPPSKKHDTKTYDSILVIVDRLTKYAILAPTHKTVTAKQTAVLLHGHIVRLFGYPDHMVSDRGRQFISGAWKAFAEQMGVKHSLSTAYHPQTDGQTERVNQVIEQYLRMYCNYEQNDWADLLDTAAFVYNNTVHNSIGVSPFFACYGWNPKAHPDIPQRLGVHDPDLFEYLIDGKERCKYLQEQIREAQRRTVDQYNRKHKDIEFKVGDMVYINRRNWKTRRPTPKLDTRFAGPYPIQERVGRRAYRITLPANLRVHDVFHVSMLEPARTSSLAQRAEQPTIPSLPDEDLDFEVEALIDKRSHLGVIEYKVLWRGYSEEAASWEPVSNLNCPDLIQEYEVSEGGRSRRRSSEQEG
ncbi:related to Gag-pol polyprotein [Ustilago sp. UG-2017b]|nr:related to Gag-pol polyprotein [Ustilago sp. UG-2017b]